MLNKKKERKKENKDKKSKEMQKDVKKEKSKKELKKENEEDESENNKEEEIEKKIYSVKYLYVYVGEEGCDDGVEAYYENGEKIEDLDEAPLIYSDFSLCIDVDTGRIKNWPDEKIYVKVYMRAKDTGFYTFEDKDNNCIYEEDGYVPDFLGIKSPAYGDDINFDTDINGFILNWKKKKIKKKIIKYLKERLLQDDYEDEEEEEY